MEIIEAILLVARELFGLRVNLENAKRERRERIAQYLETIATTLSEVATELRLGRVPHGKCAEMGGHADLLHETIGNAIDTERVRELASVLKGAHEVEQIYYELDNARGSDTEIAKLDEAAGLFRALAASVKAAP